MGKCITQKRLKVTKRIDNDISTKRKSPKAIEGLSGDVMRKLNNFVIGDLVGHGWLKFLWFPIAKDLDARIFSLAEFLRACPKNFTPMRSVFGNSFPDAAARFAVNEVIMSPQRETNLPLFAYLLTDWVTATAVATSFA